MAFDRGSLNILGTAIVAVLAGVSVVVEKPLNWAFAFEEITVSQNETPYFKTVFDYKSLAGSAHSPSISLHGDDFEIIWFDGVRESHNDVEIKRVPFKKDGEDWVQGEITTLFTRPDVSDALVPGQVALTLGNTIQFAPDSDTYLATVVSIGGWAMSSIALVEMQEGKAGTARKLPLSSVLNRSYLVRSPTIKFAEGDIGIPAYFEMGNAFGELVRVAPDGRVRAKSRMGRGRIAIQPVIVPTSKKQAVALLRNFDRDSDMLFASWTNDGGESWSPPRPLALPNPNSPVAALRLLDGRILMAFNDSPTRANNLSFAISPDGGMTWERKKVIEDHGDQPGKDVRYPTLQRLNNGHLLLTYSHGSKRGIRAHVFNENWVDQQ